MDSPLIYICTYIFTYIHRCVIVVIHMYIYKSNYADVLLHNTYNVHGNFTLWSFDLINMIHQLRCERNKAGKMTRSITEAA